MSCFFFDFGVALGAPWDGLTCNLHTPAQSKHTFSFLHYFKKIGSRWLHFDSILEPFFVNNHNFEWKKKLQKNKLKKGDPPVANARLWTRQEAPGQAATIKNCSSKKQLFEHMLKQLFEFLLENVGQAENWIEKTKKKTHDLTRPGQRPGELLHSY